ncbi:MAG TPA: hypothetical protein VFS19_02800 [Planctomycetota bacterium]|nr:hypothetical protein [Planctomycetota bacterium]
MSPAVWVLSTLLALQDPESALKGVERTEHFTIRYRPGSRAAAAVDRIAAMAERDFERITKALDVKPEGGLELHLYDDIVEIAAVTGVKGTGGFSVGNTSHIPYDNDQTRFHEMVHIIAVRLPRSGTESRNLFFAEGLANALLEFVHGVHVHAVAAFELKRKSLPALADMIGAPDFYAWLAKRPGLNAYDIAGSWMRWLLDTHGVEKVKKYYTGAPAKDVFGSDEGDLEKAWLKHLTEFKLRPEVEALLRQRRGDEVLPPALLGKPEDWKKLAFPGKLGKGWKKAGDAVEGVSETADWNILALTASPYKNAAVRARVLPVGDCYAVQLQLGEKCQAMVIRIGTFIWKEGGVAHNPGVQLSGRRELDLVLERRGSDVTIWIDGLKVLSGVAGDAAGTVGIGVAGGTARFENVRVRELK